MRRIDWVREKLHSNASRGVMLLAILVLSCMQPALVVADTGVDESQVKAAMLYRFLGYIEWPAWMEKASGPYVIAVLDAPEIAQELADITEHRTVNNREVQVIELRSISRLERAHLLFVGEDARRSIRHAARLAQERSIALVTETEGALERGSVINLEVMQNRVGFEVSLEAAQKYRLKLSARLLAVANEVKKGEGR
jgi:hypothetical protein